MMAAAMATRARSHRELGGAPKIPPKIVLQQDEGCGSHHVLTEGSPRSMNSPKLQAVLLGGPRQLPPTGNTPSQRDTWPMLEVARPLQQSLNPHCPACCSCGLNPKEDGGGVSRDTQ